MSEAGRVPYCKLDLHVHTPRSTCYSVASTSATDIVQAGLAAGLGGMAITDHNCADAVVEIRAAAEGTGLVIFPGMEITTPGGHVLAIFDTDQTLDPMNELLVRLGFEGDSRGDGTVVAGMETTAVFEAISAMGGLALAAHVERWPSGFTQTRLSRREKAVIHSSPYLSGLEITIPGDRPRWEAGSMLNYPLGRACVQGSDAHSPEDIGRRPVYMRMSQGGLQALREALQHPACRIAFPDDLNGDER